MLTQDNYTPPFTDAAGDVIEGSIAEIKTLTLGDVTQAVIIRGISVENPVLLFLHGGPGTSEFKLLRDHCPQLEELFTIAHWEQRGSGLSYHETIDPQTMTIAQLVEDAAELARYLKERFQQDQIYLMGHSWGTKLGVALAHQYPELFRAYIGFGQVGDQLRSEQVGYDWLISQMREAGDQENLDAFSAIPRPSAEVLVTTEDWLKYMSAHRPLCQKYGGGTTRFEEFDTEKVIKLYNETPEYGVDGFEDSVLPGLNFSLQHLVSRFFNVTDVAPPTRFELPMYMMNGVYDYQTSHQTAYEYFESVQAPRKRFISFENSAHTPFYDEPELFMQAVREILAELES